MTTGKIGKATPHVRIYFYEKSAPGKEEGVLKFCVSNGRRYVVDPARVEEQFDSVADIPAKLKKLFKRKGVKWP